MPRYVCDWCGCGTDDPRAEVGTACPVCVVGVLYAADPPADDGPRDYADLADLIADPPGGEG